LLLVFLKILDDLLPVCGFFDKKEKHLKLQKYLIAKLGA
jgi:hypothetical protein